MVSPREHPLATNRRSPSVVGGGGPLESEYLVGATTDSSTGSRGVGSIKVAVSHLDFGRNEEARRPSKPLITSSKSPMAKPPLRMSNHSHVPLSWPSQSAIEYLSLIIKQPTLFHRM